MAEHCPPELVSINLSSASELPSERDNNGVVMQLGETQASCESPVMMRYFRSPMITGV